ncbi:class I SAM-dependent methyltransferase [Liquorilactobacillus mali]|uniref:Methyltransferase type 11 n=2 Tax=Liquorilactobacillus mali TaxID=1618 RepID=A0A0R2E2M2_9LACO|nr:class I SAM-dependent methyltransferase [Liquorilactobacillus mali]KRN09307.1 Methyltransferase type 11 [Liquorilactobacillus mali KCTC 3596 = DSM 20444]MDV7758671.1 methyltransferase domain-containing protein [Liquorilactobacillus mali]QFQ74689.1 class I SAM-dependent methyltransferase [Liquorilactobacillus mali]
MQNHEAGHSFLARLGKTKLRPGGITATNWLLEQSNIQKDTKVLEVACNMGTTMIYLAKKYDCDVVGLDQSPTVLKRAKQNILKNNLSQKLKTIQGNALKLPFEDNTFDIVINEAMLTMLGENAKKKAVAEYYRVLKPNGVLLTHDVCLFLDDTGKKEKLIEELSRTINVHVGPMDAAGWKKLFEANGFENSQKVGKMTLMNPIGMIHDEGLLRTLKIVRNGFKKENRSMFFKMFNFFKSNQQNLGYVANYSVKKGVNVDEKISRN